MPLTTFLMIPLIRHRRDDILVTLWFAAGRVGQASLGARREVGRVRALARNRKAGLPNLAGALKALEDLTLQVLEVRAVLPGHRALASTPPDPQLRSTPRPASHGADGGDPGQGRQRVVSGQMNLAGQLAESAEHHLPVAQLSPGHSSGNE
jgi:hypothetical protein